MDQSIIDIRTDQPTDGRTDKASYRDARTFLKKQKHRIKKKGKLNQIGKINQRERTFLCGNVDHPRMLTEN